MTKNRPRIAEPPKGLREKLKWFGPGFLWMVSAAGSGELLFTPRVGSMYGYTLLWALIAAVTLKWFINREVGRYAVCTGKTVIDGFSKLPGPKNWALYIILVPQLFVAVTSVAGLAGSAATAMVLMLPGDIRIWTIVSVVVSAALVIWGRFKLIEKIATILAVGLAVSAVVAAVSVFPEGGKILGGLVPKTPDNIQYAEILPWLGFMLCGAAGLIWYSYWLNAKGYGVQKDAGVDPGALTEAETRKASAWIRQMTADTTLAVVGTLIITVAFLILGVELLKPKGLIPDENKVAEVLGRMLSHNWGATGFWFMVIAIFVGFWDTVLSNQDGFGRMFSGGLRLLVGSKKSPPWLTEEFLKRIVVVILVTIAPITVYLLMGEPVRLLKIAGAIEAFDIPILVGLILYLNHKHLPGALRPSRFSFACTALAGVFFAVFAVIYVMQLV
ncbi:MAG TPA: Nramp family divalent metal transporter [Chryseosolibacter sp.]|nr:Nramp family divalent metal transporter [Chryseosolibacter sp.]